MCPIHVKISHYAEPHMTQSPRMYGISLIEASCCFVFLLISSKEKPLHLYFCCFFEVAFFPVNHH